LPSTARDGVHGFRLLQQQFVYPSHDYFTLYNNTTDSRLA
jgi:hypothetical protein